MKILDDILAFMIILVVVLAPIALLAFVFGYFFKLGFYL